MDGKWCSHQYGNFNDVKTAEDSCANDSNCKGVWDQGCDESSSDVYLCKVGYDYDSWSSDCVYDKKGIILFLLNISLYVKPI